MLRISYWNIEGTDLYAVRCFAFNQTAVFNRHVLVKKIDLHSTAIVGCKEVSECAIIELGFVPPGEEILGALA